MAKNRSWHGLGIDWADEAHQVWEYNVGTGGKQNYAVRHSGESLQEWLIELRNRYGGKRVAGCIGTGAWRVDLCIDEHRLSGDLSGQSTVLGEIPEGALSQWSEKRSRRCGAAGRNG